MKNASLCVFGFRHYGTSSYFNVRVCEEIEKVLLYGCLVGQIVCLGYVFRVLSACGKFTGLVPYSSVRYSLVGNCHFVERLRYEFFTFIFSCT